MVAAEGCACIGQAVQLHLGLAFSLDIAARWQPNCTSPEQTRCLQPQRSVNMTGNAREKLCICILKIQNPTSYLFPALSFQRQKQTFRMLKGK